MDMFVIQRIKQLHVLTPYYSNQMDEFAKDLSNALDDSSDRRIHDSKAKKSKTWKCHSKTKCGLMLSSSVPKCNVKSEDSESSLDNWIQHQMEFSTNGSYQHTDSDDIICKVNDFNYHLKSWRHCSTNMGESDSINENFYPSREPRRKRKFKRMSVDPPSVATLEFPVLPSFSLFAQKNKRLRNLKSQKISKLSVKASKHSKITTVSQLSSKMQNICKEFGNAATSSGKRKRCVHERSVECSGCDCKEFICKNSASTYLHANSCHHLDCINSKSQEVNSSGLSSSESECGILTNDESREADDEQSDFFQESGPTCGIPSFSSWWDDDSLISNEKEVFDSKFQDMMSDKLYDISETTKNIYSMPVDNFKIGRQIRSGRRRLEKEVVPVACSSDELLPYMPFTDKYKCFSVSVENCSAKTTPNEKKKRKGMPASSGSMPDMKQ